MKIEYYLSLNSPWTYLGSARLRGLIAQYEVALEAKPCRFGAVFSATGGLPLAKRAKERQSYRLMELARWRDELNPSLILQPKHFPSDETMGSHLVIAAQNVGVDAVGLSAEIGRSLWEQDLDIGDWSVLQSAAARLELDADDIRANGPTGSACEEILEQNVKDAVARGVFGAPSYVFEDGEIMWGQDRLHFVEKKLESCGRFDRLTI
ncbi:MAG: 2-hydroxychromene-2-carboxylate isomerase [Hyphomicrobiaceae bacterium]